MRVFNSHLTMQHIIKKATLLFVILFMSSCGNERLLQLPQINQSKITEINDVSPASLFYEEENDSIELNRKNVNCNGALY